MLFYKSNAPFGAVSEIGFQTAIGDREMVSYTYPEVLKAFIPS